MNRIALGVLLLACGGPVTRDMMMTPVGGSGGGSSSGSGGGSGSSSGAQCTAGTDCPYWYCECTGTSTPVNSRTCSNGRCTSAAVACNDGCAAFGHTWTGRTFTGSSGTGGGGGSSSSSGAPGSSCVSRFDCNALTCGCTDGAELTVRDCLNNFCNDRGSACEGACVDSFHGHWDGQ